MSKATDLEETKETLVFNNKYCEKNASLEVLENRQPFSKEFDCHNRARKMVLFGSPVHYFNAETNRFENIDLSLKNSNESAINDTNSFKTTFDKNVESNSVFEITKDDYAISLKLKEKDETQNEEKSLRKQVDANSKFVVKENDDVEYNYRVLNNKVKDEIVINKKQDNYRYDFIIEVKNLDVQLADNGNINLVDSQTGQIKFFIPKPFMIDENNEISNDIDYLINKNGDSSYSLSLIPNSEWINNSNRSFPVIIDPEIVEYEYNVPFTVSAYQKSSVYYSNGTDFYWEPISTQPQNLDSNYQLRFQLDIERLNVPFNKITGIWLSIPYFGYGNIYVNNRAYYYCLRPIELSDFVVSDSVYIFTVEFAEGTHLSSSGNLSPFENISFEIEYIVGEKGNTKKIFSLTDNVASTINLANGDFVCRVADTTLYSNSLKLPIFHNYRRGDLKFNSGTFFSLNLNQRIKSFDSTYFYLNSDSEYEKIEEKFYYIGNGWCRYYVQKNQLTLNSNHELVATVNGTTYKVFREQVTESGLVFYSRLEDITGIKYYDQRLQEEKEIEDNLDSYITTLKDIRILDKNNNTFINSSISITRNSDNMAYYLENYNSSNYIFLDKSSALQLSLLIQNNESLNSEYENCSELLTEAQNETVNNNGSYYCNIKFKEMKVAKLQETLSQIQSQIDSNTRQINYLKGIAQNNRSQIEQLYNNYLSKRDEYNNALRSIPQWILDDGETKYGFNYYGNLCAVFNDLGDYFSITWKSINVQDEQIDIISEIIGSDTSVIFEYDYYGKLLSINNNGKIIKYNYSGDKLEGIFYPNEEFVRFLYKTTNLLSSLVTSNQKIFDFTYDSLARVNLIKSSSFISNLSPSSNKVLKETNYYSNLSKYQTSNITFSYQTGKTIICANNINSYYYYDDNRNVYMSYSYSLETGIYDDLKLSYLEKNFCLVTVSPKKPYQRVSNDSEMTAELADLLADMNIYSEDLPNISSLTGGQYPNFGEADYAFSYLDYFNRATEEKTNWHKISTNKYVKTITNYFYGAQYYLNPCIKKVITHYESSNPSNSQTIIEKYKGIEEYEYDGNSRLVRSKQYILGEELTNGVDIVEYEYDEKGNQVVKRTYNTLDSATKFYEESEYLDNGLLSKSFSDIREASTDYSYDISNRLISKASSNGVKIAYGYDQLDRLNSVSQSTEIGEQNKVDRKYLFDSLVSLSDRNNLVTFEYDKKRRIKTINHNGVVSSFAYSGSSYDDTAYVCPSDVSINGIQFYGYRADKIVTTAYGSSIESYYDKKGRLFEIKEGNDDKYHANYDSDLLKKEFIRKNNSSTGFFINYTYDSYRRLTDVETIDNGVCSLTENYGYDDYGRIAGKTLNYYGGEYDYYYSYSEDSRHILKEISVFDDYVIRPFIDENSRYIGKDIADGNNNLIQKEKIVYRQIGDRSTNMPSSVYYDSFTNGVKTSSTNFKYKFDASNNITEIREDDVLINRYQYDSLNRLIREDNRKLNKSVFFAYDNNGNLLSKKETNYTLTKKDEIASFDNSFDCLYDGDKMISFDGESIIYDQYNRPINYRGVAMSWDRNNLTQFGNLSFAYDGLGRRISKGSISYLYDSNSQLIGQNDQGDMLIFAYDHSGVAGFKHNGIEYIYKKNIQGDVIGIIRVDNNQLMASYVYDAWGNHIVLDANGDEVTNHSHIGFINPFRYRSYYYDNETGLYYLESRYYDPTTCRFISLDSLDYLNLERANGLNLWVYCYNNPILFGDNNGHIAISTCLLLLLAGIIISVGVAAGVAASEQIDAHGYNPFDWDWARFGLVSLDVFSTLATACVAAAVTAYTGNIILGLGTFAGLNQLINATYYTFFASSNSTIANNSYNFGYLTRWERLDYTKTQLGSNSVFGFWARQYYGEYSLHMYGYFLFPYIESFKKADVTRYSFDIEHGFLISTGINVVSYLIGLFGF